METSPHQLFLLADHIKLIVLERQRAVASDSTAINHIARLPRSLETLRLGLETLKQRRFDEEAAGEDIVDLADQITRLQSQYDTLNSDYQQLSQKPEPSSESSTPLRSSSLRTPHTSAQKTVRFTDKIGRTNPEADDVARSELFNRPYKDDPSQKSYSDDPEQDEDEAQVSNVQIYERHEQTMRDQDEQLSHLGSSIGRQRELTMAMGQEFAQQAVLLDDVEAGVDRHIGTLDRARSRLEHVSRKAKSNWSWLTIGILILILVLLIILLKT